MNKMNSAKAAYENIGVKSAVESADSHGLIHLLFDSAIKKLNQAKFSMGRSNIAEKGEKISGVVSIIDYLRVSLEPGIDPDFTQRLSSLYDYMQRNLVLANANDDELLIDEVIALLRELSEGWSGISQEYRGQ